MLKKDGLNKLLNLMTCIALTIMVGLTFFNAALRYLFNRSVVETEELARFCFIWLSYLGIVIAYRSGAHVSVTLLTDALKGKAKLAFDILQDVCAFAIMAIVLWGGLRFTISSNYPTVATGINFMYVAVALPISAAGILILLIKDAFSRYVKKEE